MEGMTYIIITLAILIIIVAAVKYAIKDAKDGSALQNILTGKIGTKGINASTSGDSTN